MQDVLGTARSVPLAGSPETGERQVRDFTQFFTDGKAVRRGALGADASPAAWRELRGALDRVGGAGDQVAMKIGVPGSTTILATEYPACMMHLSCTARQKGLPLQVRHLSQFLDQAQAAAVAPR